LIDREDTALRRADRAADEQPVGYFDARFSSRFEIDASEGAFD
jgi:hypothetical protein